MGLGVSKAAEESRPDAVYWAAYFGRVMELRQMLDSGADVNQREGEFQRTPLIATAFKDRWEATLLLLERGALVEEREASLDCTALMIAAQYNALGVAQVLLEAGANADADNEQHGQTALMWCCQYDHAQMASQLVTKGASVSKQRLDTVTPLMIAAKNNAYSVAGLLLDNQADANQVGNGCFTALMICAMVDSVEVAQLLLRHGADKAARNKDYKTALILCSENGSYRVAQLLLDSGADPNWVVAEDNGHTAATLAAVRGQLDLLRLLVEHGANSGHRCDDGSGLVELAAASGSQATLQYARHLLQISASETDPEMEQELHWAATWAEEKHQQQQKQQQQQQQQQQTAETAISCFELQSHYEQSGSTTRTEVHETVSSGGGAVSQKSAVDWAGLVDAEADTEVGVEAVPVDETVTATHMRPLGPDTGVSFEQQLLDDTKRAAAEAAESKEVTAQWTTTAAASSGALSEQTTEDWSVLMEAGAAAVIEEVTATHVRPLGPDTGVSFEQQLLDDQNRAAAEAAESKEVTQGMGTATASGALSEETMEDWSEQMEAGAAVVIEEVTATHMRPLGPDTVVSFEQQLLDDQKRAEKAPVEAAAEKEMTEGTAAADANGGAVSEKAAVDWAGLMDAEADTEADDADAVPVDETITATHVRPLGPDTGVSFEQQLLDDQGAAESKGVTAVASGALSEETMEDWSGLMDAEAAAVIEEVTATHVRPLGPDTGVSFEQQLLEDQKRAENVAETKEVTEGSATVDITTKESTEAVVVEETAAATNVIPLNPDNSVSLQQPLDDQRRAKTETASANVQESAPTTLGEGDEALRNWESLAGGAASFEGETAETNTMQTEGAEADEASEEAVTGLGPDTAVPFEQQLLEDERQAGMSTAEMESSKEASEEIVDEAVTATHVRPGLDTAVPFEQQLLDDTNKTEKAEVEEQQLTERSLASIEEVTSTIASADASSRSTSETSATSTTTTTAKGKITRRQQRKQQQEQQEQPAKKFQAKKYTVTKRIITTETTGSRVNKREAVVKISIARGEVSESVCQTEGPPQAVKWKSQRETESQFEE